MKGIQKTGHEKHAPFLYFLIGNLVLFDWRIIYNDVLQNIEGKLAFRIIQAIRRQVGDTDEKEAKPCR
ncbi:hypothetical protein C7123_00535 [Tannerella serpentiformis]|nr:hypothetical protein BCB71_05780 [Tannerella serpentiformis]AVV52347.1 hypothetical protein C7123_00535 [Tannerella serpentiformis]